MSKPRTSSSQMLHYNLKQHKEVLKQLISRTFYETREKQNGINISKTQKGKIKDKMGNFHRWETIV